MVLGEGQVPDGARDRADQYTGGTGIDDIDYGQIPDIDYGGGAHGSAGSSQSTTQAISSASGTVGGLTAGIACPLCFSNGFGYYWDCVFCGIGVVTVVGGIAAGIVGSGMDDPKNGVKDRCELFPTLPGCNGSSKGPGGNPGGDPGGGPGDDLCYINPALPGCDDGGPGGKNGDNDGNGDGDGNDDGDGNGDKSIAGLVENGAISPELLNAIKTVKPYAEKMGVDLDDPASRAAFLKKAEQKYGAAISNAGGLNAALEKLDPKTKAKLKAALKKSRYKVSSVGIGDGGGGRRRGGGGSGSGGLGFDMDGYMKGLMGKKGKGRQPSSAGLSKNFNGSPVGVASDDIFKMVSRKYVLKQRTLKGATAPVRRSRSRR